MNADKRGKTPKKEKVRPWRTLWTSRKTPCCSGSATSFLFSSYPRLSAFICGSLLACCLKMDKGPQKLSRNVWLLGWASLLNDIASEAIFPLMPRFLLTVLHGSTASLGVIEGLADSISSILKLWSGGWSDRAGTRKAFVVFGYAVAALTRPLAGLAQAPWHLVVLHSTDRLGKGLRATPRDAMVVESCDPQSLGWAFGLQRAMDHLGAAIGPLLATLFLLALARSIAPAVFGHHHPRPGRGRLLAIGLRNRRFIHRSGRASLSLQPLDANFRRYLVAVCLFTLGNSSDAFLLVPAGQLGVPEVWLPMLWLAFHLSKAPAASARALGESAGCQADDPRRLAVVRRRLRGVCLGHPSLARSGPCFSSTAFTTP